MTCILPGGLGQLAAAGPSAFDLSNTVRGTLSNGNKTVTANSSTLGFSRGTRSLANAGQRYFEMTMNAFAGTANSGVQIGVAGPAFIVGNRLGLDSAGNSFALAISTGQWVEYFTGGPGLTGGPVPAAGQVVGAAVDFTSNSGANIGIAMYVNGVGINPLGPPTEYDVQMTQQILYPACNFLFQASPADQITLNTIGPFAYPPPTGFVAWG